jgi:hypothetical protein
MDFSVTKDYYLFGSFKEPGRVMGKKSTPNRFYSAPTQSVEIQPVDGSARTI